MKTLKVQDLMVGDWVMYNPNVFIDDEYEPHKDCESVQIKSGEDIDLAIEGCFAPIPLTEDILTMNGWKDSDPNLFNGLNYVFIYGENCTLTLNHWTNSNTNEDYYTIALCGGDRVLKYVHELQRALRCCGLFDLADNFKVTSDGVTTHTSTQKITN